MGKRRIINEMEKKKVDIKLILEYFLIENVKQNNLENVNLINNYLKKIKK
jgi:hypothetical protein